jgi:N-acyl-D-aspartate/D-glutamate deacylase
MAEYIKERLGIDKIEGIIHIDRPTWWLRKMVGLIERGLFRQGDKCDF